VVSRLYASRSRVVTPHHDVLGADAVVEHIGEVFTELVGSSGLRFRCAAATGHHRSLLLRWELAGGGRVTASGLNVLLLGPDGRIEADHQFSELEPVVENGAVGS
jgi:hypothetical protein